MTEGIASPQSLTPQQVVDQCVTRAAQSRDFVHAVDAPTLHAKLNQLADALDNAANTITALLGDVEHLTTQVVEMRGRKRAAYLERNQVVSALCKCFPSGVSRTAIEGWADGWHGCVYLDLPTGQVSWHFHDSHAYLFEGLPPYRGSWDGHDTAEKYRRLSLLAHMPISHMCSAPA